MTQAFKLECKIDLADFIEWVTFLPSNLMEQIRPDPVILRANT